MNSWKFIGVVEGLVRGLGRVVRWKHYPNVPDNVRETVLAHTVKMVFLADVMLLLEREHNGPGADLDQALLLMMALLHDVGEGRTGDVAYWVKNDPRVREQLSVIEAEQVEAVFEGLPESLRAEFRRTYALVDSDSPEGRFFAAVECLGYILYALPQYKKGHRDFVGVFVSQHERIDRFAEIYPSVRIIYAPLREHVMKALEVEAIRSTSREDDE